MGKKKLEIEASQPAINSLSVPKLAAMLSARVVKELTIK
jgi:hypothetical protein